MSTLDLLLEEALHSKGSLHQQAINTLRRYMRLSTELELERKINQLTKLAHLRILQEAGLKGNLYKVAISRMNMLIKEQSGGE